METIRQLAEAERIELIGNQDRVLGVDVNKINKPDLSRPEVVNYKANFEEWLYENYDKSNTSFVLKKRITTKLGTS